MDYYVPVVIQLQATSLTGQNGPVTKNEHPVVATPAVVPQTINSVYNIPQNWQPAQPSSLSQAVVEFEQQYYSPDDLQLFFDSMGIVNTAEVTVIGPNDITNPGTCNFLIRKWRASRLTIGFSLLQVSKQILIFNT